MKRKPRICISHPNYSTKKINETIFRPSGMRNFHVADLKTKNFAFISQLRASFKCEQ